jgi:hypothetical protein
MPDNLTDQDEFTTPVTSPTPGGDTGVWGSITKTALQSLSNRTRWLRNNLDTLTGPSGALGNVTDVDTSNLSEGFILRRIGSSWTSAPVDETGMRVLENGSEFQETLLEPSLGFHDDINRFAVEANCTITVVDLLSDGNNVLRMESASSGGMTSKTVLVGGVIGGSTYQVSSRSRAASAEREFDVGIAWFDDTDTQVGTTTYSAAVVNSSSAWTSRSFELAAPTGATQARLFYRIVTTGANGEVHYFDDSVLRLKLVSRARLNFLEAELTDNPTGDSIDVGALTSDYKRITSNYSLILEDRNSIIEVDASGGNVTVLLPDSFPVGYKLRIVKIDSSTNEVNFTAGTTLSGSLTAISGRYSAASIYSIGSDEWVAIPFSGGGVGEIVRVTTPPSAGTWLRCDGSVYAQSTYPKLFDAVGLLRNRGAVELVPAATLASGESSSSRAATRVYESMFDRSDYWLSASSGAWIGADFGSSKIVERVDVFYRSVDSVLSPTSIDFEAGSDSVFSTITSSYALSEPIKSLVNSRNLPFTDARYVRLRDVSGSVNQFFMFALRWFGREYTYDTATQFSTPNIRSGEFWIKATS